MTIDLEIPGLDAVEELRLEVEGLGDTFEKLGDSIREALDQAGTTTLERKLTTLRGAFTRLKNAIAGAFAPLANVLAPALSVGLNALTRFINTVGDLMAALFGQVRRESKQTIRTGAAALKRYLADFDEIQRIGSASGTSGSSTFVTELVPREIPQAIQDLADRIRSLLEPLAKINISLVKQAFSDLKAAIEPISKALFSGLEWAWYNLLLPMTQWSAEQLLPAFLETLGAAFRVLDEVLQAAKPALQWLWEELLAPMAQWAADHLLDALGWLREKLTALGDWVRQNQESVSNFIRLVGDLGLKVLAVKLAVELLSAVTGGEMGGLGGLAVGVLAVSGVFELLKSSISQAKNSFGDFLSDLHPAIKSTVSGLVGLVNSLIGAIEGGINAAIRGINGITVHFPRWAGWGLADTVWSPGLEPVSLPRVPALAKGAVLPANRPFLAVVGDQTHGTNVEAPLTVIQEAVASVMGETLAGQDRTEELLRQILVAIGAIRVGDEVIGRAARRYESRMAGMGGY